MTNKGRGIFAEKEGAGGGKAGKNVSHVVMLAMRFKSLTCNIGAKDLYKYTNP